MTTIAYTYTEPTIEQVPDTAIWGLEVETVYEDIGKREQLNQLIQDCQVITPRYLLLRHLAELGDNLAQVNQVINTIENLGIEIIAIAQDYNTSKFKIIDNPSKKEELRLIWQEIEQKHQKNLFKQAHAQNRLKILPPPGKAPYGYLRGKDSYIINRATAPIIKDFFTRFLLFGSLRDSVNYLREKYQKKISVSTARYWLTNPVYRGDLIYKNQEIIANTHTPIISREEAAQIERILQSHRRFKPRSATANYCLAGLVKCQICQSSLRITQVTNRNKKQKYLYLSPIKCSNQPKCKSINYQQVLTVTIQQICQELPLAISQLNLPDLNYLTENILTTIQKKEQLLAELPNLINRQIFDQETAKIRAYSLKTEIAQLQQKINQLPPKNLLSVAKNISIPEFWQDLSETEKRFYLREFLKKIKIKLPTKDDLSWELNLDYIFFT
jgi:DNA invertase Pin-like site-specific DNA recombinase